jgi:hypothetical protein
MEGHMSASGLMGGSGSIRRRTGSWECKGILWVPVVRNSKVVSLMNAHVIHHLEAVTLRGLRCRTLIVCSVVLHTGWGFREPSVETRGGVLITGRPGNGLGRKWRWC